MIVPLSVSWCSFFPLLYSHTGQVFIYDTDTTLQTGYIGDGLKEDKLTNGSSYVVEYNNRLLGNRLHFCRTLTLTYFISLFKQRVLLSPVLLILFYHYLTISNIIFYIQCTLFFQTSRSVYHIMVYRPFSFISTLRSIN